MNKIMCLVAFWSGWLLQTCAPAFGQDRVGAQLYTFRHQLAQDVPGTLAKIHQMGIKYLEGGTTYGLDAQEFKSIITGYDMQVVSVGADFGELQGDLSPVIQNAHFWGAQYVVCFWIPHDGDNFTQGDLDQAIAVFNQAGKTLSEAGLTLCYHPHGFEFRPHGRGTMFDMLVEKTNPAYLSFEMDVFWVKHPGQHPVKLLKKYPRRWALMHLKDRKPGTPGNQNGRADVESNVVLGTGDVGISAIIKQARKNKISYYFIEDESSRSLEQVPQSLAYLRTIN